MYRAIERGDLAASVVCSRFRIHPDDFLAWMEGSRATKDAPTRARKIGPRKAPATDGLRNLLTKRSSAA